MKSLRTLQLTTFVLVAGCAAVPAAVATATTETCVASVYWEGFGRPLADGRHHSANELIAAHRTLPFGTRVRVVTSSGRSIVVSIADRGPFVRGRCLDLSLGAARALGIDGIAHVTLQPIE